MVVVCLNIYNLARLRLRRLRMSDSPILAEIKQLDIAQRIQLVEQIWDSVVDTEKSLGLSQQQRDEIDRRLAAHEASPDEILAWDDVTSRLESQP